MPILIGLTGLTGVGKTALANELKRSFGAQVTHLSEYLRRHFREVENDDNPSQDRLETLADSWRQGGDADDYMAVLFTEEVDKAVAAAEKAIPGSSESLIFVADGIRYKAQAKHLRENGALIVSVESSIYTRLDNIRSRARTPQAKTLTEEGLMEFDSSTHQVQIEEIARGADILVNLTGDQKTVEFAASQLMHKMSDIRG